MKQPILEINGLSFTYGCHTVLDNITLNVSPGDVVGITGPNGAGKTTLLKLVLGQLKPSSGLIKLFGTEASKLKARYRIGYLSQRATHFNFQFPATVREVVASGRVPRRGLFKPLLKQDYLEADKALEMVGLKDFAKSRVGNLSGGQQQRVFLARALVAKPELLILDEPSTGVDALALQSIYRLLGELNRELDITMLIVSHEKDGLASLITHQVCLDKKICTCSCHSYNNPEDQLNNCSRRMTAKTSVSKEPCYGNIPV